MRSFGDALFEDLILESLLGVTIPHSFVAPLPLRVVTHCHIRTGLHLLPMLILLLLLLLLSNR